MSKKIAGVSDEAVVEATGEPWSHWIALLDEEDGRNLDHRERVAELAAAGVESGWWQQKLAVGYEQERDLREVGETAGAGYQIGVQRTFPVARGRLWEVVTSREGLAAWLGETGSLALDPGETYETADGTRGEIRTVREGERVRLTWQPADRESPTTLQLTLSTPADGEGKTVLRIHHEHLEDSTDRERMREHWQRGFERLTELLETGSDV